VDGVCMLVGLHYRGKFYEFVPWNSEVQWDIQPWGRWQMQARNSELELELTATTDLYLLPRAPPTRDWYSLAEIRGWGQVNLKLRSRRGGKSQLILEAAVSMWLRNWRWTWKSLGGLAKI